MEIIEIFAPYLYSIQYDSEEECEYDRLMDLWYDQDYVFNFLSRNEMFLKDPIWINTSTPLKAAFQIAKEAIDLESHLEDLFHNTESDKVPNFDSHFYSLEGEKYKDIKEWIPMKSYGLDRPSFLRLYAIKLAKPNTYIITGGGIKLSDSIQHSPDLKDHVFKNIDAVRAFLKENGITDSNDI